jgi:hypothetical protein
MAPKRANSAILSAQRIKAVCLDTQPKDGQLLTMLATRNANNNWKKFSKDGQFLCWN